MYSQLSRLNTVRGSDTGGISQKFSQQGGSLVFWFENTHYCKTKLTHFDRIYRQSLVKIPIKKFK